LDLNKIKTLLEKYHRGDCSAAESKLIEDWLATIKNDDHQQFDDDIIKKQLNTAKSKIDQLIGINPVIRPNRNVSWLSIAASFLIIACATAAGWSFYKSKQAQPQLATQPGFIERINNGWVYLQTQKGITHDVKLPDGSLITLDASSKLRFPIRFTNHKRPVYLDEGEALFNVAKDKTSPFTVYTSKFATTALGTAFNIRSYAREHKVSISLIHGKIRVDDLQTKKVNTSKILLPHQQIVLNKQSGTITEADFTDESPITSWRNGVLAFHNASMDEVINSIENRFNVTIQNNSTHAGWSYTGTFKDESLTDVLNTVCLTEGLTCTINKNQISLN
jgi:transmembrane sensor